MLKSKVFCEDELYDTESGTPQGSLLSPTLANVALTALDDYCSNEFGRKHHRGKINPLVRYADDFVVICESEQEATFIKEKIANVLSSNIGLELSEEKTKITHISEGFNFLGFNIRKYTEKSPRSKHHERGKLLIKPQKEKVTNFLRRIQTVLDNNKTAKAETIIRLLNPMLQGFAIYYRFAVSKRTFSHIKHALSQKLWRWAKRRHPSKPKRWIFRKYFTVKEDKGRKGSLKSETGDTIINVELIPIVRFVKVKSEMRVHARDEQTREYWKNREYTNALSHIYSFNVEKLYQKQKGICPCCGNIITKDETGQNMVHTHHMLPRSEGGTDRLNNLRLLHLTCHQKAHSVLTRNQMAYLMKRKLNYILQRNIDHFQSNPNAINSI
jgi:RNA-directed DNA polymerase